MVNIGLIFITIFINLDLGLARDFHNNYEILILFYFFLIQL